MKVYIPTREKVQDEVLNSIKMQILPCEIEIVICNYDITINHDIRTAMAKEACKKRGMEETDDFFIIHDSDIVNLFEDNYNSMYDFILKNDNYGVVSLRRQNRNLNHICASSSIIRKNIANLIDYFIISPPNRVCDSVLESSKKNNFGYGYFDSLVRIKHI